MKNIKNYDAPKYSSEEYKLIQDGIYEYIDDSEKIFVTSLSFEQEPELGEGEDPTDISQDPLEDLLDEYTCYISDFYDDLNSSSESVCYQEFASTEMEDIVNLRGIIGKHVYCKFDEEGFVDLVIE